MEARNRKISEWYTKIQYGEIKLPRFQRVEAWDSHRIASLLQTVIQNLPLGITLVLEVGDQEKFISRYLETAPATHNKVQEHLLDGQQRLTALWRTFHNNYAQETYYVYLKEFDNYDKNQDRDDLSIYWRGRYIKKKDGKRYPLWCDNPARTLERGLIPVDLLRPDSIQTEIDDWSNAALQEPDAEAGIETLKQFFSLKDRLRAQIQELRSIISNYNLPFLSLPNYTDKSVALSVFINMNTNSKPLSTYDIIVAEVESAMGQSLHDLEADLHQQHPAISRYAPLSSLILTTSALLQGNLPNQRGAWNMDKTRMVEQWSRLERGLNLMAQFLNGEGIYDEHRLPTNAVLAVVAALYADIPESGDKRGQDELLLRKYMWYSFFSDRYENSAATYAFADFNVLRAIITGKSKPDGSAYTVADVPIFANHSLVELEELKTAEWPKRTTIRGRGVLAVMCRFGGLDFFTAEKLDAQNIRERHYHHVYPDALLKEAGIESFLALNCALIKDKTNMSIGRKDPLVYMKERFKWVSEEIVQDRLQSHLIPINELANGGYEGLSEEQKNTKLKQDFEAFIQKRAELVMVAVNKLVEGRQLSATEVYEEVESSLVTII
ncbi:DUF262 domain-containing protein [Leptolyngbya iicbica]|uniref:DUF262 domain-containing protein n=1 Tax=Leptolyngbya iicbica TaxID=3161580 RepID=UPI000AA50889|nr:DUF262 domain-containing protein [Leptolyngbya sp. LK]